MTNADVIVRGTFNEHEDGEVVQSLDAFSPVSVSLETGGADYVCTLCEDQMEVGGSEDRCPGNILAGPEFGPHDPEPVKLTWVDYVSVESDPQADAFHIKTEFTNLAGCINLRLDRDQNGNIVLELTSTELELIPLVKGGKSFYVG